MEPQEKRAFEPTGLVPRSIVRTFERFRQQLLPGSEKVVIREYRISRYQVLVSVRCLFALLTIPIATNWFVSSWLLFPIIEHFWNTQQNEIFLNSYQEERAFTELEFFSDKLFFESLLSNDYFNNSKTPTLDHTPRTFITSPSPSMRSLSSSLRSAKAPFLNVKSPLRSFVTYGNIKSFECEFGFCEIKEDFKGDLASRYEIIDFKEISHSKKISQNVRYFLLISDDKTPRSFNTSSNPVLLKSPVLRSSLNVRYFGTSSNPVLLKPTVLKSSFEPQGVANSVKSSLILFIEDDKNPNSKTFNNIKSEISKKISHSQNECQNENLKATPEDLCEFGDFILLNVFEFGFLSSSMNKIKEDFTEFATPWGSKEDFKTRTLKRTGLVEVVKSPNSENKRTTLKPTAGFNKIKSKVSFLSPSLLKPDWALYPPKVSFTEGDKNEITTPCYFMLPKILRFATSSPLAISKKERSESVTLGYSKYLGGNKSESNRKQCTEVRYTKSSPENFSPFLATRFYHKSEMQSKSSPLLSPFFLSQSSVNKPQVVTLQNLIFRDLTNTTCNKSFSNRANLLTLQSNLNKYKGLLLECTDQRFIDSKFQDFHDSPTKIKDYKENCQPFFCEIEYLAERREIFTLFNFTEIKYFTKEQEDFSSCKNVNSISGISVLQYNDPRQLAPNKSLETWENFVTYELSRLSSVEGSAESSRKLNEFSDLNTTESSLKIKEKIQEKILELAVYYNQQTIVSITNVAGDLISVFTLGCLFIWMKPEISILKSFLIEAIYSLSDTTKSFLLILLTDLLVGFHSPRGWETALELLLKHFGLPENQDFVFLFVATFPVLLDTVFKYWIFRHLNKISPSTVATYHSMIE